MPIPSKSVGQKPVGDAWRQTLANGGDGPIGAYALGAGKPRRCWLRPLWRAVAAVLLLGLLACARTPPEQALREQVAAMQAAVEAKDAEPLMAAVAEDFIGPHGMDRTGLRRYVAAMMLRQGRIGVVLGPLDVAVQAPRATVRFTAATAAGSQWLPDSGRVYAVQTGWRYADGRWQLVSAEWE